MIPAARLSLLLSLHLASLHLAACAEEPSSFTGSTSSAAGPSGPGATTGGDGGAAGDGGGGATGEGGGTTTGGPATTGTGTTGPTTTGSGGAPPQDADFELALAQTALDVDLRSEVTVALEITENGYVGDVELRADELPADVLAVFDEATVTLDGEGTTTVGLTLETFSDTVSGTLGFTITATAPEGAVTTAGVVVVHPTLTVIVPENLASYDGQDDAFGAFPTIVSQPPGGISGDNPVTILFFNADSVPHEIHAQNPDQGFPHSNGPFGPGELDDTVRAVNAPGTYDFYPHDLSNPNIPGRIVIE